MFAWSAKASSETSSDWPYSLHSAWIRAALLSTSPENASSFLSTPISPAITGPQWMPALNSGTWP